MDEAQLVDSLNGERYFGHVETRYVFGENLVLDQHRHEITTGHKLHEHVEESGILKRCVQLDQPGTVSIGENVALGADVSKLILFKLDTKIQISDGTC